MIAGDRARVEVAVSVPPAVAFDLFTNDIDRWWRRGFKYRHSDSASSLLRIEPGTGGRLFESFERGEMQHVIEVGRIRVWQPPQRLSFTWRNATFAEHEHTEVDIEFAATRSGTLITVTHTGLAALPASHPARHGLQGRDFARMIGMWWGEQLTALRAFCAAQSLP
jgi:uncharacterized protein YndB with AHSA1/START domain